MKVILRRAIYFITVYLFVNIKAINIQSIRIHGPNPKNTTHSVELDKELRIIFENFAATDTIECSSSNSGLYFANYDSTIGHNVIKILVLSDYMSTVWECTSNDENTFSFEIRIKKLVNVTISGESVTFQTKNHSFEDYDGIYDYLCEEGETIHLICKNIYENGNMRLRYYDRYGTVVSDTQGHGIQDSNLNFRMLISDKSFSQSYADCTYLSPTGRRSQEFTYRTVFTVANTTLRISKKQLRSFEIIGIVAGVSMTIAAAVFVYYWRRGRNNNDTSKKVLHKSSDEVFNCVDCNEYTYIENDAQNQDSAMIVNSLYCKNSQDCGLQKKNTAYIDHTEDHYTEIGSTVKDDRIDSTYALPYEVPNIIKSELPDKKKEDTYSYLQSENKTITINYNNLQRKSNNRNYSNLEHLNNQSYSNLSANAAASIHS